MILCICLSPAVDVTYHVGRMMPGATVRVRTVAEHAGGKGVNVGRVLHTLGEQVLLVAPAGGATGEDLRARLDDADLPSRLVPSNVPTRRTVTVVEAHGQATCLVEPAAIDCWPELLGAVRRALSGARVVVVSGSIPGGVPAGGVADLVRTVREHGLPVVADTHGPALLEALAAGADVVKPNAEELAQATDGEEPVRAARVLADHHRTTVVASLGSAGVVAATRSGTWQARPATTVTGNPTGAGDALVAGLARGLSRDRAA
ncbi:MAG: 1-phosphofructokinase, partial [Nocardioides sp.]|nr:1-phosphofructokinase [Nocardioides sp.]